MSQPTLDPRVTRVLVADHPKIGMLGTYPPTVCGLATFAAALTSQLRALGTRVEVVTVVETQEDADTDHAESATLVAGVPGSIRRAAAALSRNDVVIVQHEYGIFGGVDGCEVLDVIRLLTVPAVVVLHTVPARPTPVQAAILVELCSLAASVVVMTDAARDLLIAGYAPVDERKIVTIPHGASLAALPASDTTLYGNPRAQLLTWGLLGPGKGVEHVVDAVARLARRGQPVRYTVAGVTHPKVRLREGDAYRESLVRQAKDASVDHLVTFDDTYRAVRQLTRFVASASLVVLPYESREQVTSGVLVDSIAAGRPVIATAFPHAVELLSDGAGIVVPHDDPEAMTEAIAAATSDESLLRDMTRRARSLAPPLGWNAVAKRYLGLCRDSMDPRLQVIS